MDESVLQALRKWPDVPAAHGWLALDESGRWLLKGEPITHHGLIGFINRNYACDERGQWFFQNGPQRAYVRLEHTPWVLHVDGRGRLRTHTGTSIDALTGVWLDDDGNLILDTDNGPGLVDHGSLAAVAEWLTDSRGRALSPEAVEDGLEQLTAGRPADLVLRYGDRLHALAFVPRAQAPRVLRFVRDPGAPAE